MTFERWLMEMTKQIQQNPQSQFESSVEDFAKTVHEKFTKHVKDQAAIQKRTAQDLGIRLRAFDGKDLTDEQTIAKHKMEFDRKKAQDSYDNSMLMIGNSDVMSQFDSYNIHGLLYNWHLWTSLYMSSWVFARAVDKPASDMIRNGWKIKIDFKEQHKLVTEKVEGKNIIKRVDQSEDAYSTFYKKQSAFIQDLIHANALSRLYGGSVAGLIDDRTKRQDYATELTSIDEDAKLKLITADRWQNVIPSAEMVSDPGSPDWNTPKYYTIRTDNGDSYYFHHSRVLRFTNGNAPGLIKRMLLGWGIPIGVRLYNEINRDERMKNMITSLLSKQSLEIVQTAGMRAYSNGTLTPEQEKRLDSKLELINRYRHFNSILFLDKDDVYSRHEGSAVGTLAQLMDTNARFVAGAIPMPQVLLYGDQQKGLSGNAVDDMRLYEDDLMSQRKEKLHDSAIKLSKWILMWMNIDYYDIEVIWNSSISKTQTEKVDESKAVIEMYRTLKDLGIYDEIMIAQELRDNQDNFVFGSALTEEKVEELKEKFTKKSKGKSKEDKGDSPGESGPLDIGGSIEEGGFNEGEEAPGGPSITLDEMDLTDDMPEITDLGLDVPPPGDEGGIE